MKVCDFLKWASDCEKQHGSRPGSVTLNPRDVNDLYDDLMDDTKACAMYDAADAPLAQGAWRKQAVRPGYCMTIAGVSVYRSSDVPVGTYRLD